MVRETPPKHLLVGTKPLLVSDLHEMLTDLTFLQECGTFPVLDCIEFAPVYASSTDAMASVYL